MADLDLNKATTTSISVPDFIVASKELDITNATGETFWYFSEATQNMGYYSEIPEINSAANSLAIWSVGKGWTTKNMITKVELRHVSGLGKDSFDQLMFNHEVIKLIVGDAFLEIKRKNKQLVNMIPISPERVRIVFQDNGRIKRYDVWNGKKWKPIKIQDMLHSQNKRLGDQLHGTSQIDAVKWIIDARNEALITNRMLERRGRALGIVYYKTSNEGKIEFANTQIEKAVKEGQMVGFPQDTAKIEPFVTKTLAERMDWIRYLETFFYQTFGVPRSIVSSDGISEVGGIGGHLIFETIYGKEQVDLEADLWLQQSIEIKFNRPPSLAPKSQENFESKVRGESIQPSEVALNPQR